LKWWTYFLDDKVIPEENHFFEEAAGISILNIRKKTDF